MYVFNRLQTHLESWSWLADPVATRLPKKKWAEKAREENEMPAAVAWCLDNTMILASAQLRAT